MRLPCAAKRALTMGPWMKIGRPFLCAVWHTECWCRVSWMVWKNQWLFFVNKWLWCLRWLNQHAKIKTFWMNLFYHHFYRHFQLWLFHTLFTISPTIPDHWPVTGSSFPFSMSFTTISYLNLHFWAIRSTKSIAKPSYISFSVIFGAMFTFCLWKNKNKYALIPLCT